jgi:hypothetical protein
MIPMDVSKRKINLISFSFNLEYVPSDCREGNMKKMTMRLSVCLQGQKNMNELNMEIGVLVNDVPLTRGLGR